MVENRPSSLLGDIRLDKSSFLDLGHTLLNRIAESFVKAAGIGAAQAVSREAYFVAIEELDLIHQMVYHQRSILMPRSADSLTSKGELITNLLKPW